MDKDKHLQDKYLRAIAMLKDSADTLEAEQAGIEKLAGRVAEWFKEGREIYNRLKCAEAATVRAIKRQDAILQMLQDALEGDDSADWWRDV